jgi:hypothetical protein
MAKVHVCNVIVLDNPSPFLNPFQFEITFECIEVREGAERIRNLQLKMVGTQILGLCTSGPDLAWRVEILVAKNYEFFQFLDKLCISAKS